MRTHEQAATMKKAAHAACDALQHYGYFLQGPKFTGTDGHGKRDWIRTGEVVDELRRVRMVLEDALEEIV